MSLSNKHCVVTGGAGFIGSHLVDWLLYNGHTVTVIDNLSRGSYVPGLDGYNILRRDVKTFSARHLYTPHFCPEGSIFFHLAAKVTGIQYNIKHNFDMLQENLKINTRTAALLAKSKPALVVWVSTACVYPHDAPIPTPESAADVCNPEPTNFGYGVAKWVGEQQARLLCTEYGIPMIIARFFNAFGPRDYYDEATSHVAPALIRRVFDGQDPLIVWGTGNQKRSLVDARDIGMVLVKLAETQRPTEPLIVNVGHDQEVSISELANMICTIANRNYGIPIPRIETDESKPDGYARRAADTSLLRDLIGTVPETPIEETLADMIDDYVYRKKAGLIRD